QPAAPRRSNQWSPCARNKSGRKYTSATFEDPCQRASAEQCRFPGLETVVGSFSRVRALAMALTIIGSGCRGGSTTPSPAAIPLALACPGSLTIASPTGQPVAAAYALPASTGGMAPVTIACAPPSGSAFPIGSTPVA